MSKLPDKAILPLLIAGSLAVCAVSMFTGATSLNIKALIGTANNIDSMIFWQIRVPRVCLAFLSGSGLALSGMVFQALFRNPLATPFTMGVSSGAALGASVCLRLGVIFTFCGISSVSVCAFTGALLSIFLVYGLVRAAGIFSTVAMLLAGVAVSLTFSSIILFFQYISDFAQSYKIVRWLMGGVEVFGYESVFHVFPFVMCGAVIVWFYLNELNVMATGDDVALSRGVNVRNTRKILFFGTSLVTGGVVSVCGPIGFIGMMIPHICRLIIGPDHRKLAPAVFLSGGSFLVFCDALSRILIAPAEMPVGIITALLGGPFFLWLFLKGAAKEEVCF
ncbi:MAG: iron ABC transporter permease [Candidatus Theseobacter exili]|nr:iron ABC transporter permease [Candidatus Theseobacter exili]